jgi:hypothetical protein
MTPQADPHAEPSLETPPERPDQLTLSTDLILSIDVLDESGMAEVEDDLGRTFELPAVWLPGAAEGLAYRAVVQAGGVQFTPLAAGARALREKSKQTLLEFSDEHEADEREPEDHQGQP